MKEFLSIQYLRGLAAIMVVVYHLAGPLEKMGHTGGWPVGLSGGVDIFFVISGFVMWVTTRTRAITPVQFWGKRIARIVPLYWLITTFMLVVLLIAPSAMQTSRFQLGHVISSYLFLPAQNPGKPSMEPLVFPGWTLNYEMFFYLIFGLFLLARPTLRLWGTVAVLAALVAWGSLAGLPRLSMAGFYTGDVMLEFGAGMLLGEALFRRGEAGLLPRSVGVLLVVAALAVLLLEPTGLALPRALIFGVPALAVVTGALSVEAKGGISDWRLPHMLGNASYSVYLTQLVTMAAFFAVWRKLHLERLPLSGVLFCALDVAAALVVGLLCYRLVERPLLILTRGRAKRVTPDPQAAPLAGA